MLPDPTALAAIKNSSADLFSWQPQGTASITRALIRLLPSWTDCWKFHNSARLLSVCAADTLMPYTAVLTADSTHAIAEGHVMTAKIPLY